MSRVAPEHIRRWIADCHLPLLRGRLADRTHGGFFERLKPDGWPDDLGTKRTVVETRQLYSHAMGMESDLAPHDAPARHALQFIITRSRDQEQGGWFFSVKDDGTPADTDKPAYTQAFALFAMAYASRVLHVEWALDVADDLIELMDEKMKHPAGGYHSLVTKDWQVKPDFLRQNPHMHLLEAYMALHEADPRPHYRAHAEMVMDLFKTKFFDEATHTLVEYFDQDWKPDAKEGHRIEPGHHFEWVWLLHRYAKLFGDKSVLPYAEKLFDFGIKHGVDKTFGGVYDEVNQQGEIILSTKRAWVQTEYVKAWVARIEDGVGDEDANRAGLAKSLETMFTYYLLPDGRWREHLAKDLLTITNDRMPGSTSYHVLLALAEALRVLK